ncbi:MAG: DNA polymerase III subunit gamma/tau [Candidatus Binatia bacterium]
MSYLVLARKWRPQSFDDIAGQGHITRTLRNAIRANRIAHAYLFTGVRGVGKTTAARILAKALNCEKGPAPDPCNQCTHCHEITAGNSIDVLEIDGASNRGIDEIRQIIESVRYQPAKSRFKIYIIDEVHQVTKDAFNALLKTLEEPPPSVKFVLATTEPHRLPETILSRCQRFDFRRIALREVVQRLSEIAVNEGLKITDAALILLAREADGSMRDAQSLLEQVLACAEPGSSNDSKAVVDEQFLQDVLGLAERRKFYSLSEAVIQGNPKRCVEIISEAVAEGRDLCRLSKDLVEHFRNLLIAGLSGQKGLKGDNGSAATREQLLDLPDQEIVDLTAQVADLSIDTLLDYFDFMAIGDDEVGRSANPRFALETVLVRLATLPKSLPVAQLVERLEKLEKRLSADPGRLAAPGVERAPRPAKPIVENSAKTSELGANKVWQDFVAFVRKEKKFLASHLESGSPLEIGSGELRIGIVERHHLSYLQDPETLAILKTFAKQFFSSDVAVTIAQMEPAAATGSVALDRAGPVEPESDMAKAAQRIFGGTIKTVRREN